MHQKKDRNKQSTDFPTSQRRDHISTGNYSTYSFFDSQVQNTLLKRVDSGIFLLIVKLFLCPKKWVQYTLKVHIVSQKWGGQDKQKSP